MINQHQAREPIMPVENVQNEDVPLSTLSTPAIPAVSQELTTELIQQSLNLLNSPNPHLITTPSITSFASETIPSSSRSSSHQQKQLEWIPPRGGSDFRWMGFKRSNVGRNNRYIAKCDFCDMTFQDARIERLPKHYFDNIVHPLQYCHKADEEFKSNYVTIIEQHMQRGEFNPDNILLEGITRWKYQREVTRQQQLQQQGLVNIDVATLLAQAQYSAQTTAVTVNPPMNLIAAVAGLAAVGNSTRESLDTVVQMPSLLAVPVVVSSTAVNDTTSSELVRQVSTGLPSSSNMAEAPLETLNSAGNALVTQEPDEETQNEGLITLSNVSDEVGNVTQDLMETAYVSIGSNRSKHGRSSSEGDESVVREKDESEKTEKESKRRKIISEEVTDVGMKRVVSVIEKAHDHLIRSIDTELQEKDRIKLQSNKDFQYCLSLLRSVSLPIDTTGSSSSSSGSDVGNK